MNSVTLPFWELATVAATRGLLGAGVGLFLSGYLSAEHRRVAGWTLVGLGVASTIPLARDVLSRGSSGTCSATPSQVAHARPTPPLGHYQLQPTGAGRDR